MLDMAEAMQENRPQRITGAQAAHVIDIVCGIQTAFREGCRVEITSEFPQPAPMELTSIGILKAGSRGAAPGGVSGERCLGDSVKGPPDFLPPLAPEGGVPQNLYLKAPMEWAE